MNLPLCVQEFLQTAGPIFFVTPDASRAVGLETVLSDFHLVTSRADPVLAEWPGERFFVSTRTFTDAGRLLRDAAVLDYIKQNSLSRPANILTFKSSPMIAQICAEHGFRYLGPDWSLNRRWEDKIFFARKCQALGVANAHSRIASNAAELWEMLADIRTAKIVLQLARGYSGNSSFLLSSPAEVLAVAEKFPGRKYKISEFLSGEAYTLDAVIGGFGARFSEPILQITGLTEFNRHVLGTSGNDYAFAAHHLSSAARAAMLQSAEMIADAMRAEGYRGFLGFDFVMEGETAHLIETNPRLVGSVPVFTKLQLAGGELPFLLLHILEFLDFDFAGLTLSSAQNFAFAQLLLRNLSEKPVVVTETLPAGIYAVERNHLLFKRSAFFATPDTLTEGEFYLHSAPVGKVISSDHEYAGLQFGCGIMKNKSVLDAWPATVAQAVKTHIILK